NDVIAHTGKVFHTAASNEDDGVLLQVVAFTADVRNNFVAVGETHLCNLTQGGVWLLGSSGIHTSAHAATLRAVLERGALAAFARDFARLAHELANGWHDLYASCCLRYASVLKGGR